MLPQKPRQGDGVRIVAPSISLPGAPWIATVKDLAEQRLRELGLVVSYGEHISDGGDFRSTPVKARIADLHAAFADPEIKLILTLTGGYNSNQLLPKLDYDLIRDNPTALCGFSDITALHHAILKKSELVTYSGPHFANFGERKNVEYTIDHFKRCLFAPDPFSIEPSRQWSDELWSYNQEDRHFHANDGYWTINQGQAEGTLLGGNLCTLQLLQGTAFWPALDNAILVLEDDAWPGATTDLEFDRNLQSLTQQPGFESVQGLIIGRFQIASEMTRKKLEAIIKNKPELANIPIIANADIGHTTPLATFPVGGTAKLDAGDTVRFEILEH